MQRASENPCKGTGDIMTDDLKRLENRIDELTERLHRVENKVFWDTDENPVRSETAGRVETSAPTPHSAPKERVPATAIISFMGRSLVVLGGAFLLRWLTQSGILPQNIGSVLGMFYALLWIAMADVTAGRGHRPSAVFHGVTGSFIAFPLLIEATTKFYYLPPMFSAALLLAFIVLGLVVAGRRNLRLLAWIITLPAAPIAFLLAVQTQAITPFMGSLLILAGITLWLGYIRHWHVLATLVAGAVNIGLILIVLEQVMTSKRVPDVHQASLGAILSLLFGPIALYFGSYCFRVFKRKRTITPLEIGQTLVVVLIGLGGAAAVINSSEHSMLPLGIVCLLLSVASYTAAYGLLPRRDPNRRNFLFYTLLALAMMLLGCKMSLGHPTSTVVFTAIALVCGALANRISSPQLFLHGVAYLTAAILGSGFLATILKGFVGPSPKLDEWISLPILLALAITTLYPWFPRPRGRPTDMYLGRRSVDLFLFATVLAWGGFIVAILAQLSPQAEGTETFQRLLAATRTGIFGLSAVVLAWRSSRTRFGSLAWLVYSVLAIGAITLVLEVISTGGSAMLFLSFGLYGSALILAPRLLHRTSERNHEEA
jgi:hypothetical protein